MDINSSSNSSFNPFDCFEGTIAFTSVFAAYILLLPLFISVLYVGYQRWRKHRDSCSAATTSHSDIFTFHMVSLELISFLGSSFYCYGIFTHQLFIVNVGLSIFGIISPGQTLFHLLTCMERYLAVVHPVTYLRLRQAGGVRIRNIGIGCVWVICLASAGLSKLGDISVISQVFLLVFSPIVVCFCSLCILCVLNRPRPGEEGANRERVDQSKQRALYTIMAIMGALMLKFLSTLILTAVYMSSVLHDCDNYLMLWSVIWMSLPSSLVLPLLFLHRAGKLKGCSFSHRVPQR